MFFTRVGIVAAHLIFWSSLLKIIMGIGIATFTESMDQNRFYSNRYLRTETSGIAIDKATPYLMLGLAFGVLVEISRKLQVKRVAEPK